tara:strand:- start:285 stop:494 length:210 start_codon:yes stop_codon:yes gene_type:complete
MEDEVSEMDELSEQLLNYDVVVPEAPAPLTPVHVEELASSLVMRNGAMALLVLGAILMPAGVALTIFED